MSSSEKHVLTLHFAGVCTHFRYGTVPGVPHRVVLPDASTFRSGLLTVTDPALNGAQVLYYLLPHFAQLHVVGEDPSQLTVPPLVNGGIAPMRNGDILSGIRLQIRNAVDREMVYLDDATPKLADFNPEYAVSSDVVTEGRAACYFDLYGGKAWSIKAPGGATQTMVQVHTEGPPELLVTPLEASRAPVRSYVLPLSRKDGSDKLELIVNNLEAKPERDKKIDQQDGAFDFLLHYLTARGGIPQMLHRATPGMPATIKSATATDMRNALTALASLLHDPNDPAPPRALIHPDEVTPSCSDSQYP